jgi:hypothetical protein
MAVNFTTALVIVHVKFHTIWNMALGSMAAIDCCNEGACGDDLGVGIFATVAYRDDDVFGLGGDVVCFLSSSFEDVDIRAFAEDPKSLLLMIDDDDCHE